MGVFDTMIGPCPDVLFPFLLDDNNDQLVAGYGMSHSSFTDSLSVLRRSQLMYPSSSFFFLFMSRSCRLLAICICMASFTVISRSVFVPPPSFFFFFFFCERGLFGKKN